MYLPQQPVCNVQMPLPPAAKGKAFPLASSYTPVQTFCRVMDDTRGLCKGTIFEELYLPLEEGGLPRGR